MMLPLKGDDLAKADRLAAEAVRRGPEGSWTVLVQGIADCRTGRYAAAVQRLNQAIERKDPTIGAEEAIAHPLLALAHQAQGHREEARKHLERGRQLVWEVTHGKRNRTFRDNWWDWTTAIVVYAEAVHALEGTPEAKVRAELIAAFPPSASESASAPQKP